MTDTVDRLIEAVQEGTRQHKAYSARRISACPPSREFPLSPGYWTLEDRRPLLEKWAEKYPPRDEDHFIRPLVEDVLATEAGVISVVTLALDTIMRVSQGDRIIINEAGKLQDAVAMIRRALKLTLKNAEDEAHFAGMDDDPEAERDLVQWMAEELEVVLAPAQAEALRERLNREGR